MVDANGEHQPGSDDESGNALVRLTPEQVAEIGAQIEEKTRYRDENRRALNTRMQSSAIYWLVMISTPRCAYRTRAARTVRREKTPNASRLRSRNSVADFGTLASANGRNH